MSFVTAVVSRLSLQKFGENRVTGFERPEVFLKKLGSVGARQRSRWARNFDEKQRKPETLAARGSAAHRPPPSRKNFRSEKSKDIDRSVASSHL
jgi:hypothetical protein